MPSDEGGEWRPAMKNFLCTFEKTQYISAKAYTLHDKNYFAIESENNFYFSQQNKDTLEKIAEFSGEVHFVCNVINTNVYAIEIKEDKLKVTVLPEKDVHLYKLSGEGEFVIGLAAGNNSLLVRTCQDLSDDSQKNNMYFIDTRTDVISVCNDTILNESYNMPYISIFDDEEFIVAESAVIYPYEINEARQNTSYIYKNDILMTSLKNLITTTLKNENPIWNVIRSAKDGCFIQILNVNDSYIWFLETDMKETQTNIIKYNLRNGLDEINIYVKDRIDKAIFSNHKLLCMYKWNSNKEITDIYNNKGNRITNIDYSGLTKENDAIELNEIISILDDKYVIFNATDYSSDESYQCRVVYDITTNNFLVYNNFYIEYGDSIY